VPLDAPAARQVPQAAPASRVSAPAAATPELVQITFTAKVAFAKKLKRAQDLLAHRHPEGRLEDLLDAALQALLEQVDPLLRAKRCAARKNKARDGRSTGKKSPRATRDVPPAHAPQPHDAAQTPAPARAEAEQAEGRAPAPGVGAEQGDGRAPATFAFDDEPAPGE
jgi:hypothetical protein